jgi:hypothetical protein
MKYLIYKLVLIILIIITPLVFCTCSVGTCFDETESMVKADFYNMESGSTTKADSLTLYGVGMDTLTIYNKSLNLNRAEMPLYAEVQECSLVARLNGVNDTLTFRYSSSFNLISKECGYTYYFSLDTVLTTGNIIDSVAITKKTITTLDEENIRIYF